MHTRRHHLELLATGIGAVVAGISAEAPPAFLVNGQAKAAEAGMRVLRDGGNAIDAIVTAALVAAVVSPNNCGIGGYGGHMILSLDHGKKITSIDFDSAAPNAARADMFALNSNGSVRDRANEFGWLASGVPGTLAGLERAVTQYGSRNIRELIQPAIALAEDGFGLQEGIARAIQAVANQLRKDPASRRLFFENDQPLKAGETLRNPDLAQMLRGFASENSFESFYRGEIAKHIAAEFRKKGGLVTFEDMAAYRARESDPHRLALGEFSVCTPPQPAGGLTVLEALSLWKAVNEPKALVGADRAHAYVECLRMAWRNRLEFMGDGAAIPQRFLDSEHDAKTRYQIQKAIADRKPLEIKTESRADGGTIHLNSADAHGNAAALTLTHGNAFGACVTVDGLGLTLGHGMSRFEPAPGRPNSIAPGKRPLTNMCPTLVLRDQKPVLVLGGTGGRLIPNAIYSVLGRFLSDAASVKDSIAAPRLGTQGSLDLKLERHWPAAEVEYLKKLGFKVATGASANVHAIDLRTTEGFSR